MDANDRHPVAAARAGALGLALALLVLALAMPAGCRQPSPDRQRIEQQRSQAAEQWARTLEKISAYDRLDLASRLPLTAQQVALLEARLDQARSTLADARLKRTVLLGQVDGPASQADDQPVRDKDSPWAEQLQSARMLVEAAEIRCATIEGQLTRAREELANLRRMVAHRSALERLAADQERRLRELEAKLGPADGGSR